MKNYKIYTAITMFLLFIAMACSDEFPGKSPNMNDNVGAVTLVTVNPNKNFFNLTAPSLAAEEIEFTLDVDGFGITTVNNVEVELVFTEKDRLYDPFREEAVDSIYAPVTLEVVSSFPATVVVTGQEVSDALGIAIGDFELGDSFQITLPINTADGRRLTTALASDLCNEPAQPSFGGCGVAWSIACPSNLITGTVTYNLAVNVATTCCGLLLGDQPAATATVKNAGAGIYEVSDHMAGHVAPFGFDPEPIKIVDVCGTLSLLDEAGLNYTGGPTQGVTFDSGTGVWTITFDDADNGISGTAILTPQ